MTIKQIEPGFHWTNGWYFFRLPDGTVRIRKHVKASPASLLDAEAFIPAAEWASIVASVSKVGENHLTYPLARQLHDIGPVEEEK